MSETLLRPKNEITLPNEILDAAGLVPGRDRLTWRFERGELHARKVGAPPRREGTIRGDPKTGLSFWDGDISPEEAEVAALSANLDRE
jgi:hypothetical protein